MALYLLLLWKINGQTERLDAYFPRQQQGLITKYNIPEKRGLKNQPNLLSLTKTLKQEAIIINEKILNSATRIQKSLAHNLLNQSNMGASKHNAKLESRKNYLAEHESLVGWNSAKTDGIYSVNTMNTYINAMKSFSKFCAQQGAKRLSDINEQMGEDYLKFLKEHCASEWTISTSASAINKALGYTLSPKALGMKGRKKMDISRSRMPREHDTRNFTEYKHHICIAKATGIRRMSVTMISPDDCLRAPNGDVIGIRVREKGGRTRIAPVLNDYRAEVTRIVDEALAKNGASSPIFNSYDIHIDNHRFRAEYAAALLHQLEAERSCGKPLLDGKFDPNTYIRIKGKDALRKNKTQGHDTDLLAAVSGALGHSRIDVILGHYLYLY